MSRAPLTSVALAAAFCVVGATACSPLGGRSSLDPMSIRVVGGRGTIEIRRDGKTVHVRSDSPLLVGDLVRTPKGAGAGLRLAGARRLWLAPRTTVVIASESSVRERAGKVLADVEQPTAIGFGGVRAASADGAFRVDQSFGGSRAASYSAHVALSAVGQPSLRLEPLFQASISASDLPSVGRPYRIDAKDAWDRLRLHSVIALQEDLAQLADGLANEFGSRPGIGYFAALGRGAGAGFMARYLHDGRLGAVDLLIAFTLAQNAPGPLESSFKEAVRLHQEGGSWGVVAAILGAQTKPWMSMLEKAVLATGVVPVQASSGASRGATFTSATAQGTGGTRPRRGSPGGGGQTSSSSSHDGESSGTASAPSGGGGSRGGGGGPGGSTNDDDRDCSDPVGCTVNGLPSPIPTPTPTGLLGGVIGLP